MIDHYRQHPYGAHGILIALPLSVVLWCLIIQVTF